MAASQRGEPRSFLLERERAITAEIAREYLAPIRLAHKINIALPQVRRALARIDEERHCICEDCEEPIGDDRMFARPSATRCVVCQERYERRET
ncbi:MAG: TraR/DksA C4-type zinc finger protein [Candidatus Uhrbacteria bacterium]